MFLVFHCRMKDFQKKLRNSGKEGEEEETGMKKTDWKVAAWGTAVKAKTELELQEVVLEK